MTQTRSLDKFSSNILGMFVVTVEIASLLVLMIKILLGKLASTRGGLKMKSFKSKYVFVSPAVNWFWGLFVLFPSWLRSFWTGGYCCLIEKPQGLELIHFAAWLCTSHKSSVWGVGFKKSAGNCWRQDLLQNLPACLSVFHIKEPLKMLLFLHQTGTFFFFYNSNGQDPFSDLIHSLKNKKPGSLSELIILVIILPCFTPWAFHTVAGWE